MFNSLAIITVLSLVLLHRHGVQANAQQRKLEKQIIDNIFSSMNYDPRVRPSGVNSSSAPSKPVEVSVSMFVRRIHRLDDDKMLFGMDVIFRQHWVDTRLKFNAISGMPHLNLNDDDDLWLPGLFFNDYKGSTHDVTTPNILVRVWPNGTVLHSKRYNLLLYCNMDFQDYPFDTQTCSIHMESYAYRASDVTLKWKPHPITIEKSLMMIGFYTLNNVTTFESSAGSKTGDYSSLRVSFDFKRVLRYYGIQIFIPCTMMTIAGYLPFWIGLKHFNARLILALATCYTMAMQISNYHLDFPRTSYNKAVDVFTGVSLTFTFATVVETIVVYIMFASREIDLLNSSNDNSTTTASKKDQIKIEKIKKWLMQYSDNSVDAMAKFCYPVIYILFTAVYWGYYLA